MSKLHQILGMIAFLLMSACLASACAKPATPSIGSGILAHTNLANHLARSAGDGLYAAG